jgi:hypothetical protein
MLRRRLFLTVLLSLHVGLVASQDYSLEQGPVSEEELRQRFSSDSLALLEKLNRADVAHLARLQILVVPEQWLADDLEYSPLPFRSAWASSYWKALIVHLPSQVFGAYEQGRLVRWGPLSSGRAKYPTPPGLFHLNWRSPGRSSTQNPDWYMRWYFNFENGRGIAFHQLELPGRPASHACLRLLERDAKWLYDWGEGWTLDERGWTVLDPGTPVLILGQYDFDAPPPWHSLKWLDTGVVLPEEIPISSTIQGKRMDVL